MILDRDGVINEDSDQFIKSPEEWLPIPGSLEAIALLNRHGYRVVVITNQSGIARGLFDLDVLQLIHDKMRRLLAEQGGRIERIFFCPHGPDSHCSCRKPKPGLFEECAAQFGALTDVFSIGDSLRDLQASQTAGAKPILVKTGKGRQTLKNNPDLEFPVFENLYEAAHYIVTQS